jgi:hypothetical protein
MLPEDDRMIETCSSVLSVLMYFRLLKTIYVHLLVCYLNKLGTLFIVNLQYISVNTTI